MTQQATSNQLNQTGEEWKVMTMMTKNNKPGRLTDNKWWFCEIKEHDKCAVEIELSTRFEACPCECHQTTQQPTQPAPDGGEWRYVETAHSAEIAIDGGIDNLRLRAHWTGLGDTETLRTIMRQIVADHRAVPKLVDTLRLTQRLLLNQRSCDQSLCLTCNGARQTTLEAIDFALTTTQPDAGKGR